MSPTTVVKYLQLTWLIKKHSIQSAMEYKFSFVSQIVGMFVNDLLLIQIWTIFFARFPAINGWQFQDTAEVMAITITSFSVVFILAPGVNRLAENITKGNLDYYLAFPQNVLWHISVVGLEMSPIGDLLCGITMFFIYVPFTVTNFVLFAIATITSAMMLFGIILVYHSLTFYVGKFEEAADQGQQAVMSTSMYPQNVFNGVLKILLMTVIPAFFVNTLPQRILANFSWYDLGWLLTVSILVNIIGILLFHYGLKRYESGNMFQVRT